MIDFELEYINTKHPDFIDCQSQLLPTLMPVPIKQQAVAAGQDDGDNLGVVDVDVASNASTPYSKLKETTPNSPALQNPQQQEGGAWWAVLLGGSPHQQEEDAQPRPRRGGRRSSFGLMDAKEIDAYRQRLNAAATTAPATSGHPQQQQQQRIGTKLPSAPVATRKDREVQVVQHLIRCYFDIIARDLCDKVSQERVRH